MSVDVSPDLLAFLQQEEIRARNEDMLERAETALKSYNGDYYGDEVDGCSKVVSRDVAEVIDHMNVSVLRTFVSGDRVFEFEPDSMNMEQVADDATEVMHRDFQRKGYSLLHDWLKEGNINTLGIVKACVEQRRERKEIISADPEGDGAIEADPLPETDGMLHRAIVLQDAPPEFSDYLVPLEEFRIARDARDPDEAVYIAHASMKSISELKEMGFDDVDEVQGHFIPDTLAQARDGFDQRMVDREGVNRRVMLLEEYVLYDADRDGIAERLCVHRVGNTVLRIEPVDYQPFVIYCPFPMPGRIAGHSLADKVADIQRINTALMRLYLDGQYHTISPRTWVPQECVTENTYDDLLTIVPGGIVRGKGPNRPEPLNQPHDGASALQAIEFMIGQRESRTGITRLNQGLDADALNKTATGTALLQAQGQQIEEYLARNFAEAVSKLMRLKLRLYSRYGQPMRLRVDGEYREIDPRQWPEDMQVMIRVGLGSGRKDQRLQNRMMLLQIQRECMLGGLGIVGEEEIYKSMSGVVKDANLGSPADFVLDPSTPEYQQRMASKPQQPDPEMAKVQAQMQAQAAQLQMQHMKNQADSQLKLMEIQGKLNASQQDSEAQFALQQQKNFLETHLAVQQQALDANLARMKMEMEAHAHAADQARKDAESQAKVKSLRAGGALNK